MTTQERYAEACEIAIAFKAMGEDAFTKLSVTELHNWSQRFEILGQASIAACDFDMAMRCAMAHTIFAKLITIATAGN